MDTLYEVSIVAGEVELREFCVIKETPKLIYYAGRYGKSQIRKDQLNCMRYYKVTSDTIDGAFAGFIAHNKMVIQSRERIIEGLRKEIALCEAKLAEIEATDEQS